jgi:uncharacterized SAM-binding protein YcdF (DUF218 family)
LNYSRVILALTNGIASVNEVTESTKNRLDKAAEIYQSGDLIVTSTGYTVNKRPFLDNNGYPVLEAVIAARYIVDRYAIPPVDVIPESFSRDTIGNLFLAFQMIILPMDIQKVAFVTSAFHIARVRAIMDILCSVFPPYNKQVEYIAAIDPSFNIDVWHAMRDRELASITYLQGLKNKLKAGKEFTKWFYDEHRAYGYTLNPEPANTIIQKAY